MDNADRFRQYAEECKRLSERAPAKDKTVLLEISEAWVSLAAEAQRKAKSSVGKTDGAGAPADLRDDPPPLSR